MVSPSSKVFIQGVTLSGKPSAPVTRPSDLARVMSGFRPGGARPGSHLSYSPGAFLYRRSMAVKCVVVNRALQAMSPWPGTL